MSEALTWQATLFGSSGTAAPDLSWASTSRIQLDETSWVDHAPGWLDESDAIFEDLMARVAWQELDRVVFGRVVRQPRLTARWDGEPELPALDRIPQALSSRYSTEFDSVGLNLYRDGRDSVAWHGDRIPRSVVDPIVALVSLGHRRRFLLRPKGGGRSCRFELGRGDLLVTGGRCQRTWEHSVPKMATAGPRISIAFRHSMTAQAAVLVPLPVSSSCSRTRRT